MPHAVKLAVIGCGNWGINHVRTAYEILGHQNIVVCDTDKRRAESLKPINRSIKFTTQIEDILNDETIHGAVISTPAETHYEIAKRCLQNGKHVLVEKPVTLRSAETFDLVKLAEQCSLKIMAGHLLLYHPAMVKMKAMIRQGMIGQLQYIYSHRLNLGVVRNEENILLSLAPHDISILLYLLEKRPLTVEARGAAFLQKTIEDTTLTYLTYENNIRAHIFVNWLHPFKEHRLVVIGDKGMLVFEDSVEKNKLKLYPKGFLKTNGQLEKFESDYQIVEYTEEKPLTEEHRHFYQCILENRTPLTDGRHALDVIEILEAAQKNMRVYA